MESLVIEKLTKEQEFDNALIFSVPNKDILIVQATTNYIPIHEFKEIFNGAGELINSLGIKKLVFDKRSLRVFHQPSMEWYFTEWKAEMYELGLSDHVKILPDDLVFQTSVKIGREQINKKYPTAVYHKLSIIYKDSLAEAIGE